MRSRLHSDIGRFTGAGRNAPARQSLLVRSSWDLPGASRLLFASADSIVFAESNGADRSRARARSYLPSCTRNSIPRLPREFRNWMLGTHLKQKEKGITRNDHSRNKFLIFSGPG